MAPLRRCTGASSTPPAPPPPPPTELLRDGRRRACCSWAQQRPHHLPQRHRLSVLAQLSIWLQRNILAQALLLLLHSLLSRYRGQTHDPQSFVILCAPRTGSTLLVEQLQAHPEAECKGEVLNPVYEVYGDVTLRGWWRVKLHWLAMFEPPLWNQPNARAVGVKLFHVHAAPGVLACGATVDTLLKALPSRPVLLLLYRRCLVSSYLSLCRAFETDVWFQHVGDQVAPSRDLADGATEAVSARGLLAYCEDERREWEAALASVAIAGWKPQQLVTLCYEDDINDAVSWRRTRERIADRLGLSPDPEWLDRPNPSVVQRAVDPLAAQRREALLMELARLGCSSLTWLYELDLPAMILSAFQADST